MRAVTNVIRKVLLNAPSPDQCFRRGPCQHHVSVLRRLASCAFTRLSSQISLCVMYQFVTTPTRYTSDGLGSSVLDLLATDGPDLCSPSQRKLQKLDLTKRNGGSSRLKRVKNHDPSSWSSAPTLIVMAASLGSIWQEAAFAVATDWLVEAGSFVFVFIV